MRKIKRTKDFQLTLEIKNDDFIAPPRDAQRNWILNRILKETADDLGALDVLAADFVPGGEPASLEDRTNSPLEDEQIMENWQIDVMREMASDIAENSSEILEIGFGRGIASDFVQEHNVRSHTIVECNPSVIERFSKWKTRYPDREIKIIEGKWQDVTNQFETYDGILFHTYPLNEEEFMDYVAQSATFAEHFFDTAAAALRDGGRFTYLTNEIDSLSREHQRAILKRFKSFQVRILSDLGVPQETHDAQWSQKTVLVCATK